MSLFSTLSKLLITLVSCSSLGGCVGNLGVADEMLYPALPEEYSFSTNPQRVWQSAKEVVTELSQAQLLASDSDGMIMSWVEKIQAISEKIQDIPAADAVLSPEQLKQFEVKEVGDGATAVTTIYVRAMETGALMRIRRVYYGTLTQPMLAHSRGGFAKNFVEKLKAKLHS